MSWVGWLNLIVLQWFTLRLAFYAEQCSTCGRVRRWGWTLLHGIVPLTGWEWRWSGNMRRLWGRAK